MHSVCGMARIMRQREKLVPHAEGVVLEIGIGSGLNLPYYDVSKVVRLWGLDPSKKMARLAEKAARNVPFDVDIINRSGEDIPLEDNCVDTIVMTYTLCSILDVRTAVQEMARVLKPQGSLLFCEHGASPEPSIRSWQKRLTPLWKHLAGGCHLDRDIPQLITENGMRIMDLEAKYISSWRIPSFTYMGRAKPNQWRSTS
jgi:ubiquinone/menaquinone biosynthesis C-methylase UbiE